MRTGTSSPRRGQPLARVFVGLGAVARRGHCDQGTGVVQVVRVQLAFLRGPLGGATVPSLGERHEVVDIQFARTVEVPVVVRGVPTSSGQDTVGALERYDDGLGLEDLGPRVATVLVRVGPVLELRTLVAGAALGLDGQRGQGVADGQGHGERQSQPPPPGEPAPDDRADDQDLPG